jgi:predicted enzyme related to lactoylglutathione lyase
MQQNPVTWFEIPVSDIKRAATFYERVLGVSLDRNEMGGSEMAWFPMAQGAPGAAGTLIQGEGYTPSHNGSLVYISVADIEGTLKKVAAHGGKTLVPKMSIGEHGYIAHFEDCEGNRVALHSRS